MLWGERAVRFVALVGVVALVSACNAGSVGGSDARRWPVDEAGYMSLTVENFAAVTTAAMYRSGTAHMDMSLVDSMSSDDMRMSMDVRYGDGEGGVEMAGTVRDSTGSGDMVMVDGEVYLRDPGSDVYYQFPDQMVDKLMAQMGMGDPLQMLADYEDAIETVRYTTSHEVSYGQTHRYEMTMKKEFLADELDVPESEVPDFEYIMWLDDDHLLRLMEVTIMSVRMNVQFDAWGEPVTIEAPPADEVKPLPMPGDIA